MVGKKGWCCHVIVFYQPGWCATAVLSHHVVGSGVGKQCQFSVVYRVVILIILQFTRKKKKNKEEEEEEAWNDWFYTLLNVRFIWFYMCIQRTHAHPLKEMCHSEWAALGGCSEHLWVQYVAQRHPGSALKISPQRTFKFLFHKGDLNQKPSTSQPSPLTELL